MNQTTADKAMEKIEDKSFKTWLGGLKVIQVKKVESIINSLVSEPAHEQDIDNDRDYEIAQVLERELDDSITIANIMSGIQHALPLAANEQEDERGERQQVIRYVKHDINCQCGKCGTGMMAWEVQDKILTANEQKTDNEIAIKEIDRYIDNRDCPMPTEAIVHFELCKDWLQQEQECQ